MKKMLSFESQSKWLNIIIRTKLWTNVFIFIFYAIKKIFILNPYWQTIKNKSIWDGKGEQVQQKFIIFIWCNMFLFSFQNMIFLTQKTIWYYIYINIERRKGDVILQVMMTSTSQQQWLLFAVRQHVAITTHRFKMIWK